MADINIGDVVARIRVDTTDLQRGLQQTQQALGQWQQRVSTTATQTTQAAQSNQQLTRSLQQITQASQEATRAQSAWSSVLAVAGGVGIVTSLQGLISALKNVAVETVQVGARFESLQASLTAISGSVARGAQQFQFLVETAQRLGVAFEPLARGWRSLTAAASQTSLTVAEQQRLLTALATEGRRVGASNEEMSRAITALSQVASKGTLSMEELRGQLGEAIPTALGAAAKGMGITTEALTKLVETGTIRFEPFAKAFTRGLEQMAQSSGQMAETATSAFNRMTTEFQLLANTIMQSGLSNYLITVINNFREVARFAREDVFGSGAVAPLGPGRQDLTAEEQRLMAFIERAKRMAQTAQTEVMRQTYAAQVARAEEQLAQLRESIKAAQDQANAQAKVTAETNKTAFAREQEAAHIETVRKALADIAKQQEQLRANAGRFPERYGRLGGTPEEVETFRKAQQEIGRKGMDALAAVAQTAPPGLVLPADVQRQIAALRAEYSGLGTAMKAADEAEKARTKAARDAETARRQAERQALQDAEEYQRAVDKVTMSLARQEEQALATLQRIQSQFSQTREERAETTVAGIAAQFPYSEAIQEQARLTQEVMQTRQAYLDEVDAAKASFAVIQERTQALREAEDRQQAFSLSLEQTLERLQTPREQRETVRLRQRAAREGLTPSPEDEALLQRLEGQERLNTTLRLFEQTANMVGNAWTDMLTNIADGTRTVAEAFRQMARSILQSMTQIASQEAFKALIRIGFSVIGSAVAGGGQVGFAEPAGAVGAGINPRLFQHGGFVARPTLSILGEAGPEYVVPANTMQTMLQNAAHPAQNRSNVSIHNYPSREAAEAGAADARARGDEVIVNAVLRNLGQGESSQINRTLRALQR